MTNLLMIVEDTQGVYTLAPCPQDEKDAEREAERIAGMYTVKAATVVSIIVCLEKHTTTTIRRRKPKD